jgi:hypothetical protein
MNNQTWLSLAHPAASTVLVLEQVAIHLGLLKIK